MQIAGNILICAGIIFMILGFIGLFRFKNFYARILVTPLIDTVGAFAVIAGLSFIHGLSFFSFKLLLLIILMMIVNPLVAHIVARSAYLSGYEIKDKYAADNGDSV